MRELRDGGTPEMARFDDMVALVVGGADNIGRATALMLAKDGAKVAIGYFSNSSGAREGVREITEAGGEAIALQVDQSCEDSVRAMIDQVVSAYGKLNIVINNAAAIAGTAQDADGEIQTMDVDYWDKVFATNLRGPMLVCKHAIPYLLASGHGSIVNTGSAIVLRGNPVLTAYSASKKALESLTMDIAATYGQRNVRCNLVVPGLVMSTVARAKCSEAFLRQSKLEILVPFIGEPNDIAHVNCFLASPESRYITGQVIVVDGGMHVGKVSVPIAADGPQSALRGD
jgi:NAD(P)-dependent dehydrogenase (short-subunit alcohol dehydrogenase family)